ncbi:MAG: YkgJ family cysteine cluster protein [Anaerolineae bacterium]|nr:YkgJ family cysteine cluster protein [Anaerolineae bacterium]
MSMRCVVESYAAAHATDVGTRDLIRGLVYAHNRANANTAQVHEANATLQAVVDLLVERGLLDPAELQARRTATAEGLRAAYVERGMAVAVQEFGTSKYHFPHTSKLDCQSRLLLCRAACCKLPLALSKEDVQEGVVRWELGQPYMIAHAADGYCVHMDRGTYGCTVYDHRPIPCRGYDCSQDERIWLDFENKVLNPRVHEPDWPGCLEVEPGMGGAA